MRTGGRLAIGITAVAMLAAVLWLAYNLGYSRGLSAANRVASDHRSVVWSPGDYGDAGGFSLPPMLPRPRLSDAKPYRASHIVIARKDLEVQRAQGLKNVVDIIALPFPPSAY